MWNNDKIYYLPLMDSKVDLRKRIRNIVRTAPDLKCKVKIKEYKWNNQTKFGALVKVEEKEQN